VFSASGEAIATGGGGKDQNQLQFLGTGNAHAREPRGAEKKEGGLKEIILQSRNFSELGRKGFPKWRNVHWGSCSWGLDTIMNERSQKIKPGPVKKTRITAAQGLHPEGAGKNRKGQGKGHYFQKKGTNL